MSRIVSGTSVSETSSSLTPPAGMPGTRAGEQMARRGLERAMRRVDPDVHHERLLWGVDPIDEVLGLLTEDIRLVIVRGGAVELHLRSIARPGLLEQVVVEVHGGLGDLPVPLVPTVRNRCGVGCARPVAVHV